MARDLVTGMTEAQAARASRAERPMLVYVYADKGGDEDPRAAVETDRAFTTSEKVAIGARFFDCLRVAAADAAADRLLKPYARKAPCLVFVRPNFEAVTSLRARFNANRIFDAMCRTLRYDYANCVQTVVKEQARLGRLRASLQSDKDRLERINNDLADAKSAAKRRRLEKDRDTLQATIDKAEAQLREKENALYVLEPKEDKAQA